MPTRMYERVVLTKPVHLDFHGSVMVTGSEAVIVDFVDEGVVILEFAFPAPELVGGSRYETALANCNDFQPNV